MLVKFSISQDFTNDAGLGGMVYLRDALDAILTASAGSTPANPNTNVYNSWEVIANDEAGGWTKVHDDLGGFANLNAISTTGWRARWETGTKKTGSKDYGARYKKSFGIRNYSTTTNIINYFGGWGFSGQFYDTAKTVEDMDVALQASFNSSSANYGVWGSERSAYWDSSSYSWVVAATSEYVHIYFDRFQDFGGIADMTQGFATDYNDSTLTFPATIWFNTFRSSTSRDADYVNERHYFYLGHEHAYLNTGDQNYSWFGSSLYSPTVNTATSHGSVIMSFGQSYSSSDPNQQSYDQANLTYNASSERVPSLRPHMLVSGAMGFPYREMIGVRDVGVTPYGQNSNGIRAAMNTPWYYKTIQDEQGESWYILPAKGNHLKAFRAA